MIIKYGVRLGRDCRNVSRKLILLGLARASSVEVKSSHALLLTKLCTFRLYCSLLLSPILPGTKVYQMIRENIIFNYQMFLTFPIETSNRSFNVLLSYPIYFFLFFFSLPPLLLFYLLMPRSSHRLYKYQDRRSINIEKFL